MNGQLQQPRLQLGPEDRPLGAAGRETGLGCGLCQAARPPWRQDEGLALNLVVGPREDRTLGREHVPIYRRRHTQVCPDG